MTIWSEAKQYLAERGWGQGRYIDEHGCVCLSGAVCLAATRGEEACPHCLTDDMPAWQEFDKAFKQFSNVVGKTMSAWNDLPSRTQFEVQEVLDVMHEWELTRVEG